MPLDCFGKLTEDLSYDCDNIPASGIEVDVVLINIQDIDRSSTTLAAGVVTNLQLLSGTVGVAIQGIKRVFNYTNTIVVREDGANMHQHAINLRITNMSAENRVEIEKLINTKGIVAVVEKKWKGTDNGDAFIVLGLDRGLRFSEGVENSEEADGAFTFTLQSLEAELEPKGPAVLLETDYATTRTAFAGKFVQA